MVMVTITVVFSFLPLSSYMAAVILVAGIVQFSFPSPRIAWEHFRWPAITEPFTLLANKRASERANQSRGRLGRRAEDETFMDRVGVDLFPGLLVAQMEAWLDGVGRRGNTWD